MNPKFNLFFSSQPLRFCFLVLILSTYSGDLFCISDSTKTNLRKPDYFIDNEQRRIDLLDGQPDGKIALGDSATTRYATKVYFKLIDSIQRLVESPKFEEIKKKSFRDGIYRQLRKVNGRTIYSVKQFDNAFRFIQGEINAIYQRKLYEYLLNNLPQSLNTIAIFKGEDVADSFLVYASGIMPDLVFARYDLYANESYSRHVVEEAAKIAPVTVKRYFNPNDPIYETLKRSTDSVIKVILDIKDKYGRKSNAFTLLDDIVNGKLSPEMADTIGNQPEKYLRTMLKIRARKSPLAAHSLESELEIYSLKFVRKLNDLHNEKDDIRFASIEDFSPEELYTLIVYSEEEIFTSTFNGLFKRLMLKLSPVSGSEFLAQLGDNRFRTFIKMAAGFGKLSPFLQSMTSLHQQLLMIKFASGLEKYNDLSQAVEVADAFSSINDSLIIKILRGAIRYEYIRLNSAQNYKGTAIYGLLSNLFVERSVSNTNWFSSVAKQYSMPDFGRIKNSKLFGADSVDRWLIYFYDDEDGDASYSTFVKSFTDKNWIISDSGNCVVIKSKSGKAVQIYANKPKNEYDGQERLEKIFAENNFEPNVMVHRGHSYYAFKTIEKIKDNTQIFVLGSCGGYHSISSIIERSPDAGIISSKQIGTLFVNNPLLKLIAEYIRQGKDVDWLKIWRELDTSLKNNPTAYDRFLDYIPPHKNLGAIFIKTYNRMMEQE